MNFGDAVADFGHRADLGHGHPGVEILDLLSNDFAYLVCPDFLCHVCSERKVGRGWWAAGSGVFSTAHCPPPTAHLWIHQSPLHLRQLISDRAVVNQAADARDHAADDRGVGSKLQPHLLAGRGLQLALQRGLLPFADLARGRDLSRYDVHPRVEFARERLQHLIQIVQSRFAQQKLQEVGGRLTGADPREQLVEHGAFAFGRDHRAGEHVAQLRMFVHHSLEADQFLYDLVRFVTLDKNISQRARITICNCTYAHKFTSRYSSPCPHARAAWRRRRASSRAGSSARPGQQLSWRRIHEDQPSRPVWPPRSPDRPFHESFRCPSWLPHPPGCVRPPLPDRTALLSPEAPRPDD